MLQRRFDRGNAFEAEIVAELTALHSGVVVVDGDDPALREQRTADAMAARAPLILNARLPSDDLGRRVGKPDVLIVAPDGGYRPVDIKHHMTLKADSGHARTSQFADATLEAAHDDDAGSARSNKSDLLQLAHYQRMLESAGRAAQDGRFGGIIGVERRVVWYDLNEPMWRTPSSTGKQKMRSTMEIYDFEFGFRLDIMAIAMRHLDDPATPLLVIPFRKSECDECPWWDWCRPQLQEDSGHPSLIPSLTWSQWETYRDRGVTTRADVASLDPLTARLVAGGVDLSSLSEAVQGMPADHPLSDVKLLDRRPKQRSILESEGIDTVGHLASLDERTAAYASTGMKSLPEHIDRARAALGSAPVYRKRGVKGVVVPRADVEVDVDMENVEDGVYMWGVLIGGEYRPFFTWGPLTPDSEAELFTAFWEWLVTTRAATLARGLTFRAYCWHEPAENTQMYRIGRHAGLLEEVKRFIDSDEWIDLREVFDHHFITGTGSGLKVIAPITGFAWPMDDAGGGESMVQFDRAALGDEPARRWLLDYNRADVDATRAIRDWMAETASVPSIETERP